VGLLFNSEKIRNIALSRTGPSFSALNTNADQVYFQPGRQIAGSITVKLSGKRPSGEGPTSHHHEGRPGWLRAFRQALVLPSQPCMLSHRVNSSNHPVLVVSLGYMPKPWPPCSKRWNSTGLFAVLQLWIRP